MPFEIRRVEYFRITVKDEPGQGFAVLSALSSQGVNLLAFTAIPVVSGHETQLTLYPDSSTAMSRAAASSGMPQMKAWFSEMFIERIAPALIGMVSQ